MSDRSNSARRAAAGGFVAMTCVGFIASAPVAAQDAEEPTRLEGVTVTDSAVEEGYGALEGTSPKYTAPLLDTPRSISIITEDVMEDAAIFSLEEAFRTVPGITLGAGEGGVASADIPLIRGVDATGDVFVDGVRDVGSQTREVFALESIEIAKGPNSAFGGRGSAAGAINLVSKVARPGSSVTGQVTAGTSDLLRITGDINQELHEHVAVRLVGMYHESDVPGRDYVYDDRWGIAPSITVGGSGPFTATLDYYHLETSQMPDYGIPLTSRDQLPDGEREPADTDADNFYGLLARDFQETDVDALTLQLEAELGSGFVLSNTTRFNWAANNYIVTNPDDSAGNVVDGLVWRAVKSRNSENESFANNTNLSGVFETGSIGHSISLGVEYNESDSVNVSWSVDTGDRTCPASELANFNCTTLDNPDATDPWAGAIAPSTSPAEATAEEVSVYFFDTITLTDQLLINGGVRWTDFSATGSGCGRGGCFDAANDGSFWSYQGGIIFKPTSTTSLYVSYANSKTPPGTTVGEGAENLSGTNELYEPRATENWEVGGKAELFDGNALLSAALFQIDRNNILERDPTGAVTEIFDAARIRGFEVSLSGAIGPVSALVGYTYLDGELRDGSVNDGNALPQTPEHNMSATLDWQLSPQFSIGGGAYAASERFADAGNLVRADGYVRFDAHAQYDVSENFAVRVNVNNVTDERYIAKLRNPHFAVPADGRQALVTLIGRY